MGDKRPVGEQEYNPLNDSLDLISRVVIGVPEEEAPTLQKQVQPVHLHPATNPKKTAKKPVREKVEKQRSQPVVVREEQVVFKFHVSKSDYVQVKRILNQLQEKLEARIDLANLGRGWLTRLITAEKEILDAAQHHEKLKTPNPRNPLELAEVDHAMSVIQSMAFRRATLVN